MEQQLKECCVSGHVATGEPRGEVKTLGGVDTYVVLPKDGVYAEGKAIIIATDVFGLGLVNNKLLADDFADNGNFLVVVPDIFNKKPLPPWIMDDSMKLTKISTFAKISTFFKILPYLVPFIMSNNEQKKMPIFESLISDLKTEYGVENIGISGYCYGGYFAKHFAKKDEKVKAFAVAHTRLTVAEIKDLKKPGLLIFADNDFTCPENLRCAIQEAVNNHTNSHLFDTKFYSNTYHGFASRGDENDDVIQNAKNEASMETVQWFKKHL